MAADTNPPRTFTSTTGPDSESHFLDFVGECAHLDEKHIGTQTSYSQLTVFSFARIVRSRSRGYGCVTVQPVPRARGASYARA